MNPGVSHGNFIVASDEYKAILIAQYAIEHLKSSPCTVQVDLPPGNALCASTCPTLIHRNGIRARFLRL
jgi:hypothetical protein